MTTFIGIQVIADILLLSMPGDAMTPNPILSTEGQVTLPADFLTRQDWKPGDELVFVETDKGLFVRRRHRLDDLRGMTRGATTDRYLNGRDRY